MEKLKLLQEKAAASASAPTPADPAGPKNADSDDEKLPVTGAPDSDDNESLVSGFTDAAALLSNKDGPGSPDADRSAEPNRETTDQAVPEEKSSSEKVTHEI